MSQSNPETPKRLKIGTTMTAIAWCFHLGLGVYFFVLFYLGLAQPAEVFSASEGDRNGRGVRSSPASSGLG